MKNMFANDGYIQKMIEVFKENVDLKSSLNQIVKEIKNITKIEVIAIRLHLDGDYPYFIHDGFSEEFIIHENNLCIKDEEGHLLMDEKEKAYVLECMCGNIIRGRTNPELEFFTKNGSFYSNNTTKLLESTTEKDRQAHTRNYCNACGYETVVLIPIKMDGLIVGLIQLNDHKKNMIDPKMVEFIELLGIFIGTLLKNKENFASLLIEKPPSRKKIILTICCHCKQVKMEETWKAIEIVLMKLENIRSEDINFSHGICPDCMELHYDYV